MKLFVLLPVLAVLPFNASFGGELGYCLTETTKLFNGAINGCTANESAVSAITIKGTTDPCLSTSDTGNFKLTANLAGTNTDRYDLGLYLNVVGGSALSDTGNKACFNEILDPMSASSTACAANGFGPFYNADGDKCGDIRTSTPACTAVGTEVNAVVALKKVNASNINTSTYANVPVACADNGPTGAADGYLDLNACSAYHNNIGQANACSAASVTGFTNLFRGTASFTTGAGVPGTQSKCNCSGAVNVIPLTPLPDLALSCGCDSSTQVTHSNGFSIQCSAVITNNATLRTNVTGQNNAHQPGAGATWDFDLTSVGSGGGTIVPIVESSPANLPGQGTTVNWIPKGGQLATKTAGVIGAAESYTLTFEYNSYSSATPGGTHTIKVDGDWTDGTSSVPDALATSACSVNVTLEGTTYASINSVSATSSGGQVELSWETNTEIGTVGYDVYRLDPVSGDYVKANQQLLPAAQSGGGGTYRFVDMDALPDSRVTYKIFEHTTSQTMWHGPYELVLQSPQRSALQSAAVQPKKQKAKQSAVVNSQGSKLRADLGYYQAYAKSAGEGKKRSTSLSAKTAVAVTTGDQIKIEASATEIATPQGASQGASVQAAKKKSKNGSSADQIRMEASTTGIYSLSATEIAAGLGTSVKTVTKLIKKGSYSLSNRGSSVHWEALDGNEGIRFYGVANNSIYSDTNVYWLSPGNGQKMAVAAGSAPAPSPAGLTFAATAHFEEDIESRFYVATGPLDDYWYWLVTTPGSTEEVNGLQTPAAAGSGQAELSVDLYNFSAAATVDVWLNGTLLGPVSVTGTGRHNDTPVRVDPSLLQSLLLPSNTLKVEGASGITNIDSFALNYDKNFTANGNELFFTGDGNPVVTVDGFDNEDISVYDLSDPLSPVRIHGVTINDSSGSYRVSFVPSSAQTSYLAVASGGERSADQVTAYTSSGLHSTKNAHDYLIIGPAQFEDAARALVDHRNAVGYNAAFIDVQAIMDEFNDGILDPEAIRTFIAYAYSNWAVGPELVTIAGAGTLDFKGNVSSDNIVPPLMVMTRYGGLTSSENRFGDVSGGPLPEVFVSRIPAVTAGDLSAYIAKLIDYETSAYGEWQDRAVFVADDAEVAVGDFPTDDAWLAGLFPQGMAISELYAASGPGPHLPPYYTMDTVSGLLKDAFNEGAAVINYIGHGGIFQFANENMFDYLDVLDLGNQGKLPVVTALTCNIGFYALPSFTSLAEALVLQPGVGAIGVWGPTLLSENEQAVALGEKLLPELVQTNGGVFGLIAMQALQDFLDAGGNPELVYVYDFFGDAALQLK